VRFRAGPPLLALALAALLETGTGCLPGRLSVPLDLLHDLGPWKADPDARVPVSNRLLSDIVLQQVPWNAYARRMLAAGDVPFVNPHQGAGEPFLSNPQTSLFSPLAWPSIVLAERGFSLAVLARFLLAGFSMLALARELGASEVAASVSAFVYLSCGYSVVWAEYPLGAVSAVLPLFALTLVRLARRVTRGRVTAAVGAAALMTAGGHPETLMHGVAGVFAWLAWDLAARRDPLVPRTVGSGRRVAIACGAAALGFLLLSIVNVPFLAAVGDSQRAAGRRAAGTGPFRAAAAAAHVLPGAFGSPLAGELDLSDANPGLENFNERLAGYVGVVAALAVALAYRRLPHPLRRGVVVGVVALLASLRVPLLASALAFLPGFSLAANERLGLVFAFFIALAAGPSLEIVAAARPPRGQGVALLAAGALLALGGALPSVPLARPALESTARAAITRLRASGRLPGTQERYEARLASYLGSARAMAIRRVSLPGACWMLAALGLLARRRRALLLLAGLAGELLVFGLGFTPSIRAADLPSEPAALRDLRRLDPDSRWRIACGPGIYPPDLATRDGLHDVASYDAIGDRPFSAHLTALGWEGTMEGFRTPRRPESMHGLAELGVRFLLSREEVPGCPRIGGDAPPAVGLYEIAGAAPPRFAENRPPPLFAAGLALSGIALIASLLLAATASRS
jgi:hypothetical protein